MEAKLSANWGILNALMLEKTKLAEKSMTDLN
jgi:predicted outer membrane lipoprotein